MYRKHTKRSLTHETPEAVAVPGPGDDAAPTPQPDALVLLEGLADGQTRKKARKQLIAVGGDAAAPAAVALQRLRKWKERRACVEVLASIGGPVAADALCKALGKDRSFRVRAACADALGRMRRVAALPHLAAALQDGRVEVGRAAAHALGQIGDLRAVAPLGRAEAAGLPPLRTAAHAALSALGDGATLPRRLVAAPMTPAERAAALAALTGMRLRARWWSIQAPIAEPEAVCEKLLQDGDLAVRSGAREVLDALTLLRHGANDGGTLLRAAHGSEHSDASDELVRASSDGEAIEPAETWRARVARWVRR